MVHLLPERIAGWERRDTAVTFDRETIFDYINGTGEVYRSYAFSSVVVARYAGPEGTEVLVELYDMGNSADAYGVFSYGREREEPGIGGGYEHRGSVLCFWQNRFYACVASEEPAANAEPALLEIARAVSTRLPSLSERPTLVNLLPPDGIVASSEKFFHTDQALNYHYFLGRGNLLALSTETDAVLARYQPGGTHLLLVRYGNADDAAAALASFRTTYLPEAGDLQTAEKAEGNFVASASHDRFVAVVLGASSPNGAGALLRAAIERITAFANGG